MFGNRRQNAEEKGHKKRKSPGQGQNTAAHASQVRN
jgi:hypothetical protein